jgi:anti-sigma regulatory factor (Ser/Thr protein kinase)
VRLGVKNNALRVTVTDTGAPYDPLSAPAVDTSVPLENKPIGGLGIYLMKQFMDELFHEREGEKNVLTMIKGFGG